MLEIKKGYESVNKTFRIPVDIAEQLERLAGENNTSVNKVVIQCLRYALDNISTDSSDEDKK
jgi:predicted HicB family RNase H-like nuclease